MRMSNPFSAWPNSKHLKDLRTGMHNFTQEMKSHKRVKIMKIVEFIDQNELQKHHYFRVFLFSALRYAHGAGEMIGMDLKLVPGLVRFGFDVCRASPLYLSHTWAPKNQ